VIGFGQSVLVVEIVHVMQACTRWFCLQTNLPLAAMLVQKVKVLNEQQ
jgi:uncharacterized membrane protein YwzB